MMVNGQENKTEIANTQQKDNATPNVDANLTQNKVDTNLSQNGEKDVGNSQQDQASEDPNWKAFREARKKDRAEREAAERKAYEKEQEVAALKAAMEAAFAKNTPISQGSTTPNAYEYGAEESKDERIEKKVQAAIAQRETAFEKARIQREHEEYPMRLRQAYPDIDAVTAQENLDYLDYHYPEVSRPLQRLQNGFDKWADIYHAVKKFVPNHNNSRKEAAKAESNFNKPKSMSSLGATQNTQAAIASRLSEEKKAANWERMQKLLKGVS